MSTFKTRVQISCCISLKLRLQHVVKMNPFTCVTFSIISFLYYFISFVQYFYSLDIKYDERTQGELTEHSYFFIVRHVLYNNKKGCYFLFV